MKNRAASVERNRHAIAGSRIKFCPKIGQHPFDVLERDVRAYRVIEQAMQNLAVVMVHSLVSEA
jgi:hypothetical protein